MFFDLHKHIFEKYNIPEEGSKVICINAERNVGKTTALFNYLFGENPKVDIDNKILIIRNTGEQLKTAKQDFNARLKGRYEIWGNLIYKMTESINEKTGDIKYSRGDHIGYIGSLTQFTNMKSVEARNVKYVFFDEYAEVSSLNVYDAFISMLKTFERFNKIIVFMLGNRESLNNEWMLNWNVLPNEHNYKEDRFVHFSPRGYFIELGTNQFKTLGNDKTLSNELGNFNENTKNYLSGGYKKDVTLSVKSYKYLKIKEFKFGIAFKLLPFALVELEGGDYGLLENKEAIEYLIKNNFCILAVDDLSYTMNTTTKMNLEGRSKVVRMLIELFRSDKLIFDSFNGLYTLQQCSRFYGGN